MASAAHPVMSTTATVTTTAVTARASRLTRGPRQRVVGKARADATRSVRRGLAVSRQLSGGTTSTGVFVVTCWQDGTPADRQRSRHDNVRRENGDHRAAIVGVG